MTDPSHDDDLRRLLSELDPMPARVPVEPVTSPQARHLLEQIMNESNEHVSAGDSPSGTAAIMATTPSNIRPLSRGRTWLAAAAAVAILGFGTTVALNGGGSQDPIAVAPTVLALKGSGLDPLMQMCLAFDVATLRQAPVAFAGTVTRIDAEKVTLDVDRWFKGGNADEVTVAIPAGQATAALDGVNFEQDKRFLISATDGVLGGCGYSGPASSEFEKSFEEAFGA